MLTNYRLLIVCLILAGALGCGLFSGKTSDTEEVFASTEVGTPEGDKVTRDIGPAGGSIASPDGRLTLAVPQNALAETVTFAIQPITNKAGNGLGSAYRLEPNGKTFATPLEISVRYDDHDLEGTVPEALSLAYQDQQGAWHAQKSAKLDPAAKTLTVATTHFTDFAFLARLRLLPVESKLHPGVSQGITLFLCKEPGFLDKILSRRLDCSASPHGATSWKLRGPGTIGKPRSNDTGVLYTAPATKPADNIAWVDLTIDFYIWNPDTGATSVVQKTFSAKITILGLSYEAKGQTADVVWSGAICSLDQPFTVSGSVIGYKLKFTPSSATAGTVSITAAGMMVTAEGGGTYKIEGGDTEKPRIAVAATAVGHSPVGSRTGSGTIYIDLVPLNTVECSGK